MKLFVHYCDIIIEIFLMWPFRAAWLMPFCWPLRVMNPHIVLLLLTPHLLPTGTSVAATGREITTQLEASTQQHKMTIVLKSLFIFVIILLVTLSLFFSFTKLVKKGE